MWFNHTSVDNCCYRTISSIAKENSTFCIGYQHDSHECMIWLLNKLNQEILDSNLENYYSKGSTLDQNVPVIKTGYSINLDKKDNKEDKKSFILKLFQGQFRHEIKCTAPDCDFVDISTEPFLSVSLSVPLQLCFELMKDGAPLLPKHFYKMNLDFKLHLLDSDGSVYCTLDKLKQTFHGAIYHCDPATLKPFLNSHVDKVFNDKENNKKVIQIIVEWDLYLKNEFQNKKEQIKDDNSLLNKFNNSKENSVPLFAMLDNFVKSEPIQFWNCPKCNKLSGSMQIKFDYLPDILVFYLKRFDQSGGHTKKNNKNVLIPLEELDMSSYVDIQDSLKKLSKKRGKFECKDNKYDLSCVIYHHGYAFSSGHYTAAVRNSIDEKWRLFNDTYVSERHKEEISKSDCSYMLFYQRRPSVPWFPQNVPENIIEKYQGEKEKDERDYKQFNDQDSTKRRNDNDSRRNDKNTTKQRNKHLYNQNCSFRYY
uniref:ubiquitinyl hydrolase 1 n=1 Tax=Meloidogyne enterolobii TaxID=390850 RepID=A0A6V7VP02_MELEN|nr:unnamed protein product [Meloidogyne enterolobii]